MYPYAKRDWEKEVSHRKFELHNMMRSVEVEMKFREEKKMIEKLEVQQKEH